MTDSVREVQEAALKACDAYTAHGVEGDEAALVIARFCDELRSRGLTITDAARLAELENFFDGAHIRMWNLTAQETPEYRVVWPQRIMSSEQAKALWPSAPHEGG